MIYAPSAAIPTPAQRSNASRTASRISIAHHWTICPPRSTTQPHARSLTNHRSSRTYLRKRRPSPLDLTVKGAERSAIDPGMEFLMLISEIETTVQEAVELNLEGAGRKSWSEKSLSESHQVLETMDGPTISCRNGKKSKERTIARSQAGKVPQRFVDCDATSRDNDPRLHPPKIAREADILRSGVAQRYGVPSVASSYCASTTLRQRYFRILRF